MAARVSSCLDTAPSWSSACGRRAALNALTMRGKVKVEKDGYMLHVHNLTRLPF